MPESGGGYGRRQYRIHLKAVAVATVANDSGPVKVAVVGLDASLDPRSSDSRFSGRRRAAT